MGIALQGQVALVTGASRGVGRGIALQLGEAGATVYITGRRPELSDNLGYGLPGLQEVAEEITAAGGQGIALYIDHSNMFEVQYLFDKINKDQDGRLDILVNNVFSSIGKVTDTFGKAFYEIDPSFWDTVNDVGLRNHYYCSVYAARIMVPRKTGMIVNIASLGGLRYAFNVAYGVGKDALVRMATDMAVELEKDNICVITLMPGPVRTEAIEIGVFGGTSKAESAEFTGKALARFAMDPGRMKKTGKALLTGDLAQKYGFGDRDGMEPQNIRSVKTMLETLGKPEIAKFIPNRVKVPKWMIWQTCNRL
ncbi:unnamed protein product [Caenorhabditis angaria]|uniref:Uncharacterized protein n=1 Tax=Caenorhabditis angaria TaxID=860376 RepID=A0A9P1IWY0_9PELO|nr:unnamed protein product [Caenorhabditis angaria]